MLLELPGCQILLFKLVKTTHATGLIPKYAALSRTKNVTIDLFTTVSKASTSTSVTFHFHYVCQNSAIWYYETTTNIKIPQFS